MWRIADRIEEPKLLDDLRVIGHPRGGKNRHGVDKRKLNGLGQKIGSQTASRC